MKLRRSVLFAALSAFVLVACGGADDAPADVADGPITIEAGDLYFDPETVSAAAGDIEITLVNVGAIEHDLVIEATGEPVVHVDPGETATGTVTLDAGTYDFYCAVPGHRESGMVGTLTVN